MTLNAEIKVILPQAKEPQGLSATTEAGGEVWNKFSLRASRRNQLC